MVSALCVLQERSRRGCSRHHRGGQGRHPCPHSHVVPEGGRVRQLLLGEFPPAALPTKIGALSSLRDNSVFFFPHHGSSAPTPVAWRKESSLLTPFFPFRLIIRFRRGASGKRPAGHEKRTDPSPLFKTIQDSKTTHRRPAHVESEHPLFGAFDVETRFRGREVGRLR